VTPHVFLDALPWDMRSRNTDWRYIRYTLPKLSEFVPELRFASQHSRWQTVGGNAKAIWAAAGRRVGMPISMHALSTGRLSGSDLRRSGANLIFCQSYPLNAGTTPVVWENAIVDPEMQLEYGVAPAQLEEEIAVKRPYFLKARKVQVFTEAEAERHRELYPQAGNRFFAVPWFAPHIKACDESNLEKHIRPAVINILFVGNNALRKGLPQLFEAFLSLSPMLLSRARLTVISNFDRSPLRVPSHPQLDVIRGAGPKIVMEKMRQAHIFVNVAHFESYGVVFHEAMSQGAACLAPRWEVQRELFDNGRAGMNLKCESEAIRLALEALIDDETLRLQLGYAAWQRFQARYAPDVVARRYAQLFYAALEES
jgi:glycosyltransferase involved in cell wall biosynthesis